MCPYGSMNTEPGASALRVSGSGYRSDTGSSGKVRPDAECTPSRKMRQKPPKASRSLFALLGSAWVTSWLQRGGAPALPRVQR
jgi:hypothetical protein